jgi:hypothetical protein
MVNLAGQSYTASFAGSSGGATGDRGIDQVTVSIPANPNLHGLLQVTVSAGRADLKHRDSLRAIHDEDKRVTIANLLARSRGERRAVVRSRCNR